MKVVSQNSETDIKRHRAMANIRWSLRDLTANLLRVTRGAGKSYALGKQAQSFIDALLEYQEAAGCFPSSDELDGTVTLEHDHDLYERVGSEHYPHKSAEQQVIKGALQIVASRLIGQLTVQRTGEKEMHDGIRALHDIRDERRQKWRKEELAAKAKARPAKRSRKSVLRPGSKPPVL